MGFTEAQQSDLRVMTLVCSAISLSGSCFIFTYYWLFKDLRTFAFNLVLCVAISDSIRCIGNLMGLPENQHPCNAQGMLKTFGGCASFLWVMCMALTIRLIYMSKDIDSRSLFFRYNYVVWTIASISALIPFFTSDYEQLAIGWCWISNDGVGAYLRYTSFYGYLFAAILWICFVYLELWCRLKGLPGRKEYGEVIKRLWLYPLVLIVGYGPAATRRVLETLGGTAPFWLAALQASNSSLMGFLNTLAYGVNADVRRITTRIISTYCCCYEERELGSTATVWRKKNSPNSTKSNSASTTAMVEIKESSKRQDRPAGGANPDLEAGHSDRAFSTYNSLPDRGRSTVNVQGQTAASSVGRVDTLATDFLVSPKSDESGTNGFLASKKRAGDSAPASKKRERTSAIEMTPPKKANLVTARTISNKTAYPSRQGSERDENYQDLEGGLSTQLEATRSQEISSCGSVPKTLVDPKDSAPTAERNDNLQVSSKGGDLGLKRATGNEGSQKYSL